MTSQPPATQAPVDDPTWANTLSLLTIAKFLGSLIAALPPTTQLKLAAALDELQEELSSAIRGEWGAEPWSPEAMRTPEWEAFMLLQRTRLRYADGVLGEDTTPDPENDPENEQLDGRSR